MSWDKFVDKKLNKNSGGKKTGVHSISLKKLVEKEIKTNKAGKKLNDWIDRKRYSYEYPKTKVEFISIMAKKIKVSEICIFQWLNGNRRISLAKLPDVVEFTGGELTAVDLRPDFKIFREEVSAKNNN